MASLQKYYKVYRGNDRVIHINTWHTPMAIALGSAGLAAVTINTTNQWYIDGNYMECYNTTASTAIVPDQAIGARGGINLDTVAGAANKTIELTMGNTSRILPSYSTRDAQFVRMTFRSSLLANITSFYVGFRAIAAYNATPATGYGDYAAIGVSGTVGKLQTLTQISSGAQTITDTTNTVSSNTTSAVQVNVSASGVVTFLRDTTGSFTELIAPTTVPSYTFSNINVVPFIIYTTSAGWAGGSSQDLCSFTWGLLSAPGT